MSIAKILVYLFQTIHLSIRSRKNGKVFYMAAILLFRLCTGFCL